MDIHIKNMQINLNKLNKSILINRKKRIFDTWVEYFDTPNDDNIAKHALLLYDGILNSQNLHDLSG
jgi:hypothetical protein